MNRREFLKAAGLGGAMSLLRAGGTGYCLAESAATSPAADPGAGVQFDPARARRELGHHWIKRIEFRGLQDVYPRSVGPNAKTPPVGRGGRFHVAEITTDQGMTGWAMAGGKEEEVKNLIGARVGDLFDPQRGLADDAPWWLDKVMHDLAGRILGRPVWRMIGAKGPREIPLYSGAIYLDDVMPAEKPRGLPAVLEACRQDYDAGYRAFKLKIGRGFKYMDKADGLRRDIEVTRAVRQAYSDCRLLVDANNSYTVQEMCDYVRAVADCDLYWIEEPFEEDRDQYRRLREVMADCNCKALIADGESRRERAERPTAYGGYTEAFVDRLFALAAEKLVDVFVLDLDTVGFSRWRRVMPALVKAGVQASPHTWAWTARTHYTAQLAAGAGNIPIVEGIPGKAEGIDYSAYKMKDGRLVLPDAAGFGLGLRHI